MDLIILVWSFYFLIYHGCGLIFKGATSRGFRGFWAQTILKLVVANLIQVQHYL